jgi:hypothetical protein
MQFLFKNTNNKRNQSLPKSCGIDLSGEQTCQIGSLRSEDKP